MSILFDNILREDAVIHGLKTWFDKNGSTLNDRINQFRALKKEINKLDKIIKANQERKDERKRRRQYSYDKLY